MNVIWLRCFEAWGTCDGAWDPSMAGSAVVVNLDHVIKMRSFMPDVVALTVAYGSYGVDYFMAGTPAGILRRIQENGTAAQPKEIVE